MASAPKDGPKDKEIKRLREERDEARALNAKYAEDMKWFAQTKKLLTEKKRLATEVEELREFKDEAEPRLAGGRMGRSRGRGRSGKVCQHTLRQRTCAGVGR